MSQQPSNTLSPQGSYTVSNTLVNMYLTIMFSFFPLFLTEQYAHARKDKYIFYLITTGFLIASVGSILLIKGFANTSKPAEARSGEKLFLPLSLTDVFMLGFIWFAAISTILSDHPDKAFWGTGGRNNGLFLLLFYALMYFLITRNYAHKDYVFVVYLITSSFVALLTVLNFFYIDPLGMLDGYDPQTIENFGSTIGNKNIIAAFMCLFLPVAVMLFVVAKAKVVRIVAGIAIGFAYTGLLCADSTSDILGLLVILPVTAIFCARSFVYLRRWTLGMVILFLSPFVVKIHLRAIPPVVELLQNIRHLMQPDYQLKELAYDGVRNKGFEFMQETLFNSSWMILPIVIFGVAYALMFIFGKDDMPRYPAKAMQIILLSLFSVGIIALLWLFIRFSFYDTETDIGEFEKLLRFDDYWGTHRGFMWRVSFEEYRNFTPLRRLFGAGPDTAYYVLEPHFPELMTFGDSSTDCAHNEFINYLLTQGALGLMMYLGMMGSAVVRGLKAAKSDPMALVFISAVICYLAQSTVNLYNPIVTPTLFIFFSLAEATARNTLLMTSDQ